MSRESGRKAQLKKQQEARLFKGTEGYPGAGNLGTSRNKHDTALFATIFAGLAAPLLFMLQANGVIEIGWGWSIVLYAFIVLAFTWSFLKWEVPDRWSAKYRLASRAVLVVLLCSISVAGGMKQYRKEHAARLEVAVAYSVGTDSRDTSGALWFLREDYIAPISEAVIVRITNTSDMFVGVDKFSYSMRSKKTGKRTDMSASTRDELSQVHELELDDGGMLKVLQRGGMSPHAQVTNWLLFEFPSGFVPDQTEVTEL